MLFALRNYCYYSSLIMKSGENHLQKLLFF